MWLLFSIASAFFAGVTAILAKIGVTNINSNLATALRTVVVVIFAWIMVFVVGSHTTLLDIETESLAFLILSGLATGASWLCYFKALQLGDVNKVVPVDKTSTVLTMLWAFTLLGEGLNWLKVLSMVLILTGTFMMIEFKEAHTEGNGKNHWLIYALGAALFASLTAILGKVGIAGVESNLGTALRTIVVLVMAWILVFAQGSHKQLGKIDRRNWLFLGLSGLATGLSWLCFYRALQEGPASVVVPIDKLSILITVAFGSFVLKERLSKKAAVGLALIVAGTMCLLI